MSSRASAFAALTSFRVVGVSSASIGTVHPIWLRPISLLNYVIAFGMVVYVHIRISFVFMIAILFLRDFARPIPTPSAIQPTEKVIVFIENNSCLVGTDVVCVIHHGRDSCSEMSCPRTGADYRLKTIYDNLIDLLHVSIHSLPTSCRAPSWMSSFLIDYTMKM